MQSCTAGAIMIFDLHLLFFTYILAGNKCTVIIIVEPNT